MKVLVTGATGYVGHHLATALAGDGIAVHALCRSAEKARAVEAPNIRPFIGDVLDRDSLLAAAEGCAQVYHCAALVVVWSKDPGAWRRVNVDGTMNVLAAAAAAGAGRTVITSTASVFGPSAAGAVVDETTARTVAFFNEYESSKAEMQEAVAAMAAKGTDAVIVSPTRVFGPGPDVVGNTVTKMIDLYLRGRWRALPGGGNQVGNYVYVDDVVAGHRLAMEKGAEGETYILGGTNATYREFFARLAAISGKEQRLFSIPIPILSAAAWLELKRAERFGDAPRVTPSWVRRYTHDWTSSSARAARDLGYAPRSLDAGLEPTVAWLREADRF